VRIPWLLSCGLCPCSQTITPDDDDDDDAAAAAAAADYKQQASGVNIVMVI
jgi:hypothetical protein